MQEKNIKKISVLKKIKRGSFSALLTIIVIAAVILFNVILKILPDRFNVKIDLTENRLFSIEQSTSEYLKNLDSDIKFIITSSEENFLASGTDIYYSQMNETARLFAQNSSKITLEYTDLIKNPSLSGKYTSGAEALAPFNIIVESEKTGRYKVLAQDDYLDIKYFGADGSQISEEEASMYSTFGMEVFRDVSAAAEQSILSAIMSVINDNPIRIAFTNGFDEGSALGDGTFDYSGFMDLLEKNSYLIETLDLNLTNEINEDIDFLISYGPKNDYDNQTISKIDRWLDNNGNYGKNFVFIPWVGIETPNIDAFLAEWGLKLDKSIIWQTDLNYVGGSENIQQYLKVSDSDYSSSFENGRFFGYLIRAVDLLFETNANITTSVLLESFDGAVRMPIEGLGDNEIDTLKKGVLNAAAESKKARYDDDGDYESRVLVFGSAFLFDNNLLTAEQFNHAEYFVNLFNILSGKETEITLSPKTFMLPTLNIPAADAYIIAGSFCLILPIGVLVSGIAIWLRRRRK
ncbi:MAG: GldG family protein [Eubacterium sp.]|jgi:hypothetical protein|nr:GldG family protein [Eubacterium sp.]